MTRCFRICAAAGATDVGLAEAADIVRAFQPALGSWPAGAAMSGPGLISPKGTTGPGKTLPPPMRRERDRRAWRVEREKGGKQDDGQKENDA